MAIDAIVVVRAVTVVIAVATGAVCVRAVLGGWIRTTDYLIQSQGREISESLTSSAANSRKCGSGVAFQA